MSTKKSLTRNTVFYALYNIVNIFFPLISGIYVANILTPDAIGVVESARNLATYFVIFSFIGIPTYGVREIAKHTHDKKQLNKIYSELLTINAISTTIFLLIYSALILLVPAYNISLPVFIVCGLSIFLNYFNNTWLFEGLEEFSYISIRNLIFKILSFILLIAFVRNPNDYLIYASISVIGTAGNYILNIIQSKKFVSFTLKNLNLKNHLKPILYLAAVNLAIEIYTLVDITMLNFMSEKANIAYYSYGSKFAKMIIQLMNTIAIVIVPQLVTSFEKGKKENFKILLSKATSIIIVTSIPIIIGIHFVSDFLITSICGSQYATSATVLKILSFNALISSIGYILGSRIALVTKNESKMIIPVGAGAITNIIFNILLIPKHNEIGAAIASVIGECVVAFTYLLLMKKYIKNIDTKKAIKDTLLASSIMTAFLVIINLLNISPLIKTCIEVFGAINIYGIIMLLRKNELIVNTLKKLKRKA